MSAQKTALVLLSLCCAALQSWAQSRESAITLKLTSSAFADAGEIPAKYTCEGQDVSPPLAWSGVPSNARSLALIVDDPDAPDPAAPAMTWVHWVLYGLPPDAGTLPEGTRTLPPGTRQGSNDWQRTGYGGPCPPVGRHRYFFKLYALDALLPDLGAASKAKLEAAMKQHVIARAELVGTYRKRRCWIVLELMVGAARFELATTCTPCAVGEMRDF